MKSMARLLTPTATFIVLFLTFIGLFRFTLADASSGHLDKPQANDTNCFDFSVRTQNAYTLAMKLAVPDSGFRESIDDETFIPGQIILSGSDADRAVILENLSQENIDLVSISRPFSVTGQLVELFEVHQDQRARFHTVRQLICEVDKLKASNLLQQRTYAEPNYLVSAAPWWAESSQWYFAYIEEPSQVTNTMESFNQQWIWGSQGIGLLADSTFSRTVSQQGANTKVIIFDSSPIPQTGQVTFTFATTSDPLTLNVITGTRPTPSVEENLDAFASHGLFAASLIHKVAPEAQIDLVPVIDSIDGRSDLFSLARVVNDYVRTEISRTTGLTGTILNFSLGVHHPVTGTFDSLTEPIGFPSKVMTLKHVLKEAHDAGAVIVAAAGNNFAFGDPTSVFMQAPASYDFVIGVGGSSGAPGNSNGRSCFSNNGDIFAPGGDGNNDCTSPPSSEDCQQEPELCIIGLTSTQNFSNSNAGFRIWVGSSFAAPQVSGLAALILGEAFSMTQTVGGLPAPEQVRGVIECGTSNGPINVINVAESLHEPCIQAVLESSGEVRFREQNISVQEDAGMVDIVLERVNGSRGTLRPAVATVDDFSSDSPATPGQDYETFVENIIFNNSVTEITISIPILDNNTAENDETFKVALTTEDNSIIEAIVTIVDDDVAPPSVLQFSSPTYSFNEDTKAVITVLRNGGAADEVQVDYITMDGTAIAGDDYQSSLSTLTFAPGESEKSFTIELFNDSDDEPNETIGIRLNNVVGAASLGSPSEAIVTILDNDGEPNPTPMPSPMPTQTPPIGSSKAKLYLPLLEN